MFVSEAASSLRFLLFTALLTVLLTQSGLSQTSSLDPTFAPVPSRSFQLGDLSGKDIVALPDGKAIIWGFNFSVDGQSRAGVARLNADGSLDTSFTYCGCLLGLISNAAVLPDGKVLVAGYEALQAKIVRLNQDGSHDPTFVSSFTQVGASVSVAHIMWVYSDGRILIDLRLQLSGGFHARYVTRHLADGSPDPAFTSIGYDGGTFLLTQLNSLAVDSAGKIYMAMTTTNGSSITAELIRRNSDGSPDGTWETPSFPSTGVRFLAVTTQADGSLILGGRFNTVNGAPKVNLVRLAAAGNVDLNFTAPVFTKDVSQVRVLADGKLLVLLSTFESNELVRLNSDGTLDNTFAQSPIITVVSRATVDSSQRIYVIGSSESGVYRYVRLNQNGDLDATYNPNTGIVSNVQTAALQPDGLVLLAGSFSKMNGVERGNIARVHPDGRIDATFTTGSGFSSPPSRLVVQPDGKIIATGAFFGYNGVGRVGIARLNADGTLDGTFAPVIASGQTINTASVQPDGKILIAGNFTSVNSFSRTGVARLNADGSLDASFNPLFGNPNLNEIFRQADGKIVVGGAFNGVNGFNRTGIVRLNDDGTLDTSFNVGALTDVKRVWRQADGKYFFAGSSGVGRRLSDGTQDSSFVAPTFSESVESAVSMPDNTYIVVGSFSTVGGVQRGGLVKLASNGSVDSQFFPTGANAIVRDGLRQADGKVVIVGDFTRVAGAIRSGGARLILANVIASTPFDFDGDGRADFAVYRPSTGVWYELSSATGTFESPTFGIAGDIPVPADFDGDGKTDEAIFRPSSGDWWYRSSVTGGYANVQFGQSGDIARPFDFDGDGKSDFVLYRPSDQRWYRAGTLTGPLPPFSFGAPGDQPVTGDFDGDGKYDIAIFRPSSGEWWYAASGAGMAFRSAHWGQSQDIPVPADYDGDGKTDHAVFRPSNGGWYIFRSSDASWIAFGFGTNGDRPVAADYDGDGRADAAVFRPSEGIWYLLQSTAGTGGVQWGVASDVAIPNAFLN